MTRANRIRSEFIAAWVTFLRRRTAVFFTFFFPIILILIFGVLVGTQTAGALFSEPPEYYVPGYLAVVVLFTPLSRLSSNVARYHRGKRFEKLATTPLSAHEWLFAHTVVNILLVGVASLAILVIVIAFTPIQLLLTPIITLFIIFGVTVFCGVGAIIGRVSDSQDGAIAASNGIGLPLLFLSDTFIPPSLLPAWFQPVIAFSPLTYFARGVRSATVPATPPPELLGLALTEPLTSLGILFGLAILGFTVGARVLPWRI